MEDIFERLNILKGKPVNDYSMLGFGTSDIAVLKKTFIDTLEDAEVWDYSLAEHAFLILAAMQSKVASKVLVGFLNTYCESEWLLMNFPRMMAHSGASSVSLLKTYFCDTTKGLDGRSLACETLSEIGKMNDALREDIVNFYRTFLLEHNDDSAANTSVIASLCTLKAEEAIDDIRSCFANAHVINAWCGDLEDVEIQLGIRKERSTPRPDYSSDLFSEWEIFETLRSEPYDHLRESEDLFEVIQWYLLEYGSETSIWDTSEFHGFMTAIICAPKPISPSLWLPQIWGERDVRWESKDDFAAFFELALTMNNDIVAGLGSRDFEPLFLSDEKYKANPKIWCEGFLRGKELWKVKQEDVEFVSDHTTTILLFGIEFDRGTFVQTFSSILATKGFVEDQTMNEEDFKKVYAKILDKIVHEVQALYDRFRLAHFDVPAFNVQHAVVHRTPKVGRNEKCPCGSGKKIQEMLS